MTESEIPSTVRALFSQVVGARAARDAIATLDETVSYAELDRRSAEMARGLLAIGAGKGTRIALLAPDGIFWITAFLASMRIGALLTLVSTLCAPRELAHMIRHSDISVVIVARRFLTHDYGDKFAAAFPELAQGEAGRLQISDAPYLRSVWLDDPAGLGWAGDINALLARAGEIDAALLPAIEAQVTPSDDAVIIYTSGSTSLPKAVVHSQWTLVHQSAALADIFLMKPDDRMLPMLPVFWVGGLTIAIEVLGRGGCLVYPTAPDLETVLETLLRCRANRFNSWGDGLVRMRELATARGVDVAAIVGLGQFCDADGAPIPPAFQVNMLGMSESFGPHSAEPLDFRMPDGKAGAAGRAVNGYERRVVDPGSGMEVPPGEIGELQLRGGGLMSGFYKRRRCEVFTADGFYPTGDLVRLDASGWLTFVARRGDMIKTRSANVSRLEVEAALNALPGVAMSVVIGLDHAEFGQIVAAAVVPVAGVALDEAGLRNALRDMLSSYKVPRRIVFVTHDDIPRTVTGKLRLHEIAQLIALRSGDTERST